MKKMVAVGLVALAVGLVMPGVFAQAPQAEFQKWEQFCERHTLGAKDLIAAKANPSAAAHGKNGYQLVSSARGGEGNGGSLILCYRRLAR